MRNLPDKTKPRRVDFFSEPSDFKVAMLASLGFDTYCIMNATGLTFGQVTYRLMKAQIKRKEYRHGESALAQNVMRRARDLSANAVEKHIRDHLE